LLEAMKDVPDERRGAHFYCAMALVRHAGDPAPLVAIGRWDGAIARAPAGSGGFGYDPLFRVPGQGCTSAELDPAVKNRLSHRGQALAAMRRLLQDELRH
jgi:XTP/dITP diphosphohydrolase